MPIQHVNRHDSHIFKGARGIFLLIFILTLLGIISYQGIRDNFFSCDDFAWLRNARITMHNPLHIFTTDIVGWFRPIGHLLFAINYRLFGLEYPVAYAMVSLALHIVIACLFFLLIVKLLGDRTIAFWAAALFTVHYTHWEAVAWSSIIAELVVLLWGFGAILCFMKWREASDSYGQTRKAATWYYACTLLLMVCSFLSAESAVTLPAMLILTDMLYHARIWKRSPVKAAIPHIPLVVLWTLYVLFELWLQRSHSMHIGGDYQAFSFQFIIVMFRSLLLYIFPKPLVLFISQSRGFVLAALWVWGSLVMLGVLVLFIIKISSNYVKDVFYGICWIGITILPFCGFTRFLMIDSRHYYLPSVGVCLLFGIAVCSFYRTLHASSLWKTLFKKGVFALCILGIFAWNIIELWHEDKIFEEYADEGLYVLTELQKFYTEFPTRARLYFAGLYTPSNLFAQMIDMYFGFDFNRVYYSTEAWMQEQRQEQEFSEPIYLFVRDLNGFHDLSPDQFKYLLPQDGKIDAGEMSDRKYLPRGFSYPEQWTATQTSFAWSNEAISYLKLAFGELDSDIAMTVRARPFEFENAPQQTITVFINDREIGQLHLHAGDFDNYTLNIPKTFLSATVNMIQFHYAYHISPARISKGQSHDGRELGVALDYILFQ